MTKSVINILIFCVIEIWTLVQSENFVCYCERIKKKPLFSLFRQSIIKKIPDAEKVMQPDQKHSCEKRGRISEVFHSESN